MASAARTSLQQRNAGNRPAVKPPMKRQTQSTDAAGRLPNGAAARTPQRGTNKAQPVSTKAASIAGESPVNGVTSAYAIMASRIANRVAEMAESLTFVERPKPREAQAEPEERKRPRKLEMRLGAGAPDAIAFSAPFLDNTLQKMLALQNRMLASTAALSKAEGLDERVVREHAAQSAELSRIIALICAEKARQGA